ncbi:uncharacterized protein LOC126264905 [Aethina tumida]|uniref:uncharacterized protein LOC126264905 n=1 Tax=Aethina tumida TaxID=116153 RepID=UPI0021473EBF|nr:uncharacterized protein LOC126264905 [Aethina tumida]
MDDQSEDVWLNYDNDNEFYRPPIKVMRMSPDHEHLFLEFHRKKPGRRVDLWKDPPQMVVMPNKMKVTPLDNPPHNRFSVDPVAPKGRKKTVPVYDAYGIHIETRLDMCDCLDLTCCGCFFPCPKCQSNKCGTVCRCNRTFIYDSISDSTDDFLIESRMNPILSQTFIKIN